jgi:hypothetical protein
MVIFCYVVQAKESKERTQEVFDAFVRHKTDYRSYDEVAPHVNKDLGTDFSGGALKKRYNEKIKTLTRK